MKERRRRDIREVMTYWDGIVVALAIRVIKKGGQASMDLWGKKP